MYTGHREHSFQTTSLTIGKEWQPADASNPEHGIPLTELQRPDPILFYAEIPLFEDELHDNGASTILVRIVSLTVECAIDVFLKP